MSALLSIGRPDLVRQSLALGLSFLDAATGEPLSAPLRAVIETAGTRRVGIAMLAKASGAALRFDPRQGPVLSGAAGGELALQVLIAPQAGLGRAAVPDRSVVPRRVLLSVRLDADGLLRAPWADTAGSRVFDVRLHTGPTFPRAAGMTGIVGRLLRDGPGPAQSRVLAWAHVEGRMQTSAGVMKLVGTARTDDRGEFLLRPRGHLDQAPDALKDVPVRLRFFAPPAAAPAIPRPQPYADVPTETLGSQDTAVDAAPAGYIAAAETEVTVMPGRITQVSDIALP
jgi:hypothetical protein